MQPNAVPNVPLSWWVETLCITLGDLLAVVVVAIVSSLGLYAITYPGFRVSANWSWVGWDLKKMGRFPNSSDSGAMRLWPNISVTSYDTNVKKLIAAVWVRQRSDVNDPGEILGKIDLRNAVPDADNRTTGGDVLNLRGPEIACDASQFQKMTDFPVFIQTSDGEFYRAISPGNPGTTAFRARLRMQRTVFAAKRRFQNWLG